MPSGKVHTTVSVVAGGLVGAIAYGAGFSAAESLALLLGCSVVGSVVSPDLDVDAGNISDMRMRKFRLGILWSVFWSPYRLRIKHRSVLSHAPIVGTLIRILYVLFPPIMLFLGDQKQSVVDTSLRSFVSLLLSVVTIWFFIAFFVYLITLPTIVLHLFLFVVLGLIISDTLHFIADVVV